MKGFAINCHRPKAIHNIHISTDAKYGVLCRLAGAAGSCLCSVLSPQSLIQRMVKACYCVSKPMDELNVHQLWGISPFVDLMAASTAAASGQRRTSDSPQQEPVALLQLCSYDCRHTLATICGMPACKAASSAAAAAQPAGSTSEPCGPMPPAAAVQPAAELKQQSQSQQQLQQQLQLYVYEAEPEVLARHMLLLAVLLDGQLTPRERAEAFLELHGNALLRPRTAEYLAAKSKWLEESVAQLSLNAAAGTLQQQRQQQAVGRGNCSSLGVLEAFDLSLLRYQDRDALLETFQKYRHKAQYDMARAWAGRLRKWYGQRYDCRTNVVDWDYHMRLSPRGTPFLDPAAGSIVHFYHFRHWRLTGVAHELRGAAYTAANTSLLSTAYGRTKEFKDRQLRDVGRSVSAFGYWGDMLNSPFHAFGTLADDPALFKLVNKQFSHTAVDVAEHNVLGFINSMCGPVAASASRAAEPSAPAEEGHRANAARGPTSMQALAAAGNERQQQEQQQQQQEQSPVSDQQHRNSDPTEEQPGPGTPPQAPATSAANVQQVDNAAELSRLSALEAKAAAAAAARLVAAVKIFLVTGDLKKCLTGRPRFAGRFAAATVGHRHVHLLGPEHQVQQVLQPGGLVLLESGQNMVQLNSEQVAAFEERVVELARAAGFEQHRVLGAAAVAPQADGKSASSGGDETQQNKVHAPAQQEQQQSEAADSSCLMAGEAGSSWRLPPGHIALRLQQPEAALTAL